MVDNRARNVVHRFHELGDHLIIAGTDARGTTAMSIRSAYACPSQNSVRWTTPALCHYTHAVPEAL
jgi:hypothetical protein